MPTELTTRADENSTYVVTAAFIDEDDSAVTPNSGLTWSLTDSRGRIVNSRDGVSISPDTSVDIILQGSDLALPDPSDPWRTVTVEGTYDSSLGSNLPLKGAAKFKIGDLKKVT